MRIILFVLFIIAIVGVVIYFITTLNRDKQALKYSKLFGLAFLLYSLITVIGNTF